MLFFGRVTSGWLILWALATILGSHSVYSQVYPYTNYSVRQGLVNSNVYAIAQDQTGYIWLGTENGLSRFDGIGFKNYTLEELGLKSFVSSLTTTENGTIIFGSGSSGIYSFNPVSGQLNRLTKKPILRSNQLLILDDLLVSLHENRSFNFISLSTGEIKFDDDIFTKNTDIKALSMVKLKNGTIIMGRSDGLYKLDGKFQRKIEIKGLGNTAAYSLFEDKNSLLVGGNGYIFRIIDNCVTDTIHARSGDKNLIRNIKVDTNGNLWFSVWGSKDVFMMSDNIVTNVSEPAGIINGTITEILLESSGSIFISTISKGFYLFSNNHLIIYPESEKLSNSNIHKIVKTKNGGMLLGTYDGLAYLDPSGKSISSIKHMPEITQYVRDIVAGPGNQYLVATIDNKFANSFSKLFDCKYENIKIRYSHCSSIWADSVSVLAGNWDNKLIQYRLPEYSFVRNEENIFYSTSNTHRINCMFRDEFNRLWIGSQQGLCIIDQMDAKFYPQGVFQEEEIYKISSLPDGNILVVANTGFYLFKNNLSKNRIVMLRRNAIQGTNCVANTGKNEFLVGTSYGLLFQNENKKTLMTIQDGILSENINDIYYEKDNSHAWIATSGGLMKINLKILRNENTAPIEIREVKIIQDEKSWLPQKTNTFKYISNSFGIKFQAFHYHNPQKIKYQYKVDEGDWIQAPTNEIQFASMMPGSHSILLRAGLTEKNWGPVKTVNISILPPYYMTWWFYLISFSVLFALLFVITKWQIGLFKKKQQEKIKTQQKIVELQQKALASNLNPHFVFNSLNAIQHFINSKSPAEANEYLAKFARLMRMHLNMAEKSSILLHEEIQRLEYYLSLEQLRFDDKMEWSITIHPDLDAYNLEIPNMIIQPFVENAIWHGIMPSSQKGLIALSIEPAVKSGIEITITDNGVGFDNQPKRGKADHESKGTRLIRERLLLLDASVPEVIRFEHLSPGTRVYITLTSKMIRKKTSDAAFAH